MPISIDDAAEAGARLAATKAGTDVGRYSWASVLAGAYVGLAIVVLFSVSGPLAAAGNPATKLVQAAVFGLALTLVVFAGAELFTGNTMFMVHGLQRGTTDVAALGKVWAISLVGNVVGSILLAAMVHAGGSLSGPANELIASAVTAKDALAGPQLFWRAVLCNALVCLGLWMASRATSDGAKLATLWWALLAFIGAGFEHSIANATTFSLAVFDGSATWGQLARNLLWTVPGNVVGGGLIVGVGYGWLGHLRGNVVSRAAVGAPPAALAPSAGD